MIFRTINTDAKRLTEQFGLLSKSFRDIKKDFSNGLGIKNSLFQTSISKTDWQSLQKFNSAIKATNDGLTKSQRITKAWNENMTGCSMAAKRMGNDLITGKQKISDISNSMKTATASTKALGVAMNVFVNVGFMLAITAISKVVSELAQAQENAVQAAKEATESYNDEISSINDYKTRLSELHKELNSGNLSYEETKTKRTELMSIQDELIEKFGTEKDAIKSVTDAINGQVDALDDLNEKSYRDWVAKADEQTLWNKLLPGGKSGLDQAIDYMETDQTVSFNDMQNANLSDELQEIQKKIDETIKAKYNLDKTFATFNVTGTPEEIKSQLEAIRQEYLDLSKDAFLENGISSEMWEEYRKEAIDSLNEVINKFDDGLEKHQETYQTYIEGMIKYDSEYSDEYATILQKRAELESAQNSGNETDIQNARQEFMDAINEGIRKTGNNENIKNYFKSLYPELQSEFSNWTFEFDLKANVKGLKDTAIEIGEKYTAVDLLNMVNTEGIQDGEESFNLLIDKAIEYGVCTDKSAEEVQKLIDLLVELGYAQGNVKSEAFNDEIARSFFSILNSADYTDIKEELLDLAKSGEITSDVLESTAEYNALLSETGLTSEEAKDKITNLLTAQEKLAAASNGLDSLSSAFEEFKDIGFVTAQTLESLPDVFKKLGGWDIFSGIVGSGTSTADEVQQAFNDIVKQYLIAQNTFSGLINASESEIQSYIANLKQMGVTNAEEVVNQTIFVLNEQNKLVSGAEEVLYEGYKTYLKSKSEADLEFLKDSSNKNGQLVAALGSAYTQDYNNWCNLLSRKAEAYNQLIKAINASQNYTYDTSKSTVENIIASGGTPTMSNITAAEAAVAQYKAAEAAAKKAQQALQLDLSTINTNFGGSFSPSYSGSSGLGGSSGSGSSGSSSSVKEETEESFSWIERAIKKVQHTIDNLGKTVSATYKSWATRNNALAQEISAINSEISTQQKSYDYYMKKANSLGLSSSYVNKIKNGSINIETITNESLIEKIQEYQDLYDKAIECQDAIIDLKDEIASLARMKFDNIVDEYDDKLSAIEHRANMLEAYLDQTETRGYLLSTKYYESLKQTEKENIAMLEQEYSSLTSQLENSMKTGNIEEGSEEWASMKEEIYGVEEALIEANTALIEYNNSLRELEWEVFDFLQDRISAVTDETQFLIDLMSNKDLYDDKGNLTDEGMATMGLHGQNYNVYMSQADQYAKEIEELNKELEADPNNTALIERREELLELQRESILAAEDEKQAIIDMVEEGINVELEALQKLIDSYNEALDSAKDLYDYQKKVKDLTDEIASLEKQQSAYLGDDSEENKARIQQIKVQLEEARENLEETEYEHYISEQKKLLDELFTEYESILNSRLDNVDALLSDMIDSINANASTIDETLRNESEKVGYTMTDSLQDIWSNEGCASTIISKYGDGFLSQLTSVNNVLNAIAKKIGAMTEESDKQAETNIKNETAKHETKPSSSTTTTKPPSSTATTTTKTIKVGGKINAGSAKIYDYAGDTSGESQYYKKDPVYVVLEEKSGYLKVRHHSLSSGITGWFKKSDVKAYKTGGLADETGLAWLDGTKSKPEMVLNPKDTENILGAADTLRNMVTKGMLSQLDDFTKIFDFNGGLPKIPNSTNIGDITNQVNIAIEHVDDYNDFVNQLREDPKFEKMIQSMTTDRVAGGGKLAKNKFRW